MTTSTGSHTASGATPPPPVGGGTGAEPHPPSTPADKNGHGSDASLGAWYSLGVLVLVALYASIDRQLLFLIAEPLRQSLDLTDVHIGLLQGIGLTFFVGVAAFPIGWLADKFDRRLVLACCIMVWGLATVACGMAQTFPQLLLATIFLGIGEAGLAPIAYGLIPELFRNNKRPLANAIFVAASGAVGAAAFQIGGQLFQWVSENREIFPAMVAGFDPWRISFILAALPGPIVAVLIATMRVRHKDGPVVQVTEATDGVPLMAHLKAHRALFWRFFIGYGVGALALATAGWAPVIAARVFGAPADQIGTGMAASSMAGLLGGIVLGPYLLRKVGQALGDRASIRLIWCGFLFASLCSLGIIAAQSALHLYILMAMSSAAAMVGAMAFPTVVQDMAPEHLRSRLIAISVVIVVPMQTGAPVLVGLISDLLSGLSNGLVLSVAAVAFTGFLTSTLMLRNAERLYADFRSRITDQSGSAR